MQVGILGDPDCWDSQGVLERAKDLVAACRGRDFPIIYVQHDGGAGHPISRGEPGWPIHPEIAPRPEDTVVHKRAADAFYGTHLKDELEMRGIRNLLVAGLATEKGVDATCRRAASLDFDVWLVSDGHSTSDNGVLKAKDIIAHHNLTLTKLAHPRHPIRVTEASRAFERIGS